MNYFATSVCLWLADFFLLSTVLLVLALTVLAVLHQPAHRVAITKATFIALVLLANLCAVPRWSLVHLISHASSPLPPAAASPVPAPHQHAEFETHSARAPAIDPAPCRKLHRQSEQRHFALARKMKCDRTDGHCATHDEGERRVEGAGEIEEAQHLRRIEHAGDNESDPEHECRDECGERGHST